MSRSTKLIVILSNLAAIWLIAELTSRVPDGGMLVPTIVPFMLSWLSAVWLGDVVTSIVLSTLYLVPAACFLWFGRRPVRAGRVGAPYTYGFTPDKSDPSIRWTGKKAVDVFQADKRWLKMVFGDVAPDAATKPVLAVVRLNRDVVLRVRRQGNYPIARWVRMPATGTPLMLEIDVDRTWRPSDFGDVTDTRARGVEVREWSFSYDDPPKGSVTIESPPPPLR